MISGSDLGIAICGGFSVLGIIIGLGSQLIQEVKDRMAVNMKVEKLLAGETIISKEPGNSMLPLIKSRQPVKIEPSSWEKVEVGDIVYCKVHGHIYTHLVKAKDANKGVLIGNNHGHDNGWTKIVYGKIIEILPME
jgi:hypothetical protein